jgi:hypothetical protein
MRAAIYQVYFDEASKARLDPGFLPYDNSGRRTDYYENGVLLDVHSSPRMWEGFDYVGVVSWRFADKTGLSSGDVSREMSGGSPDVFLLTPGMYMKLDAPHSRRGFGGVQDLAREVDRHGVLPYRLYDYDSGDVVNFCNFWAAKPRVFDDYCRNYLRPMVDFLESSRDEKIMEWRRKTVTHRGKPYPPAVFMLEGLFQTYVHHSGLSYAYVGSAPLRSRYRANRMFLGDSRRE